MPGALKGRRLRHSFQRRAYSVKECPQEWTCLVRCLCSDWVRRMLSPLVSPVYRVQTNECVLVRTHQLRYACVDANSTTASTRQWVRGFQQKSLVKYLKSFLFPFFIKKKIKSTVQKLSLLTNWVPAVSQTNWLKYVYIVVCKRGIAVSSSH